MTSHWGNFMNKEYVKIIIFAVQSVITVAVIVLACIFGIPCKHKPEDLVEINTEATCTEDGKLQIICTAWNCNAVVEEIVKPASGHEFGPFETRKTATCTEQGLKVKICRTCGYEEQVKTNANGHTKAPVVEEDVIEPTCTEKGSYNEVTYCSVCDAKLKTKKCTIDALGHEEIARVENYLNANCTFNGSYDDVIYCSRCDEELDRQPKIIYASGHDIVAMLYDKAMKYSCADCGFVSNGSESLKYELNEDGTYTVVGIDDCADGYVFIPAYVDGKKVVAIGDSAFANTAIKYIGIPPTIESIGNRAFAGCKVLDNVVLSQSLTTIGQYAFAGCHALKSIRIHSGVTIISDYAFYECITLESVVLPDGVKRIGRSAFHNTAIKSIVIPDSVTRIGDSAFNGCTFLSEITLGKSITTIGSGAFFGCKSLVDFALPEALTGIGDQAFSNCENLVNIVVPGKVTNIGKYAFSGCTSLEKIFLPYTLTSLGFEAFHLCNSLTLVEFDGTDLQWEKLSADLGYNYGGYVVTFGTVEYQK